MVISTKIIIVKQEGYIMKKKLLILTALATTALLITGCQHQIKANSRTTNFKTTAVKKKTNKIDLILKHMTLNEKIGQLYFAHSTGNTKQMMQDVKNITWAVLLYLHRIFKIRLRLNLIRKCAIIKKTAIMVY